MRHFATPEFWSAYNRLPEHVRRQADRHFVLLKNDPRHASLHLKRIGRLWSVRLGIGDRALGTIEGDDIVWFWIGSHADYDNMLKR